MSHTKRTRKSPTTPAGTSRGGTLALITTLALSLATAIGAAAWLIATQEVSVMSVTTTRDASPAAANAQLPTPVSAAATTPATTTTADDDNATLDNPTGTAPNGTAIAAQPTTTGPAVPSAAGQRAFIDPVTGELRQPEHDEIAALDAAAAAAAPARRAAARTASAAEEFFIPDGSIGAVVPEDLHTFTVATRGPDGRIVIEHAQGAKNADNLVKANSTKNPQAPVNRTQQKEVRHER